jgi:hypothetical protein
LAAAVTHVRCLPDFRRSGNQPRPV